MNHDIVTTAKGTELPLVTLKGKKYLMVAYRIQWMNEVVSRFEIKTNLIFVDDTQTIVKAQVSIFNEEGQLIKSAEATKRETKSDFSDHTEKAETGAIGRALALLGFGTQFALADLDEGTRIVDAPLDQVKEEPKTPRASFKKPKNKSSEEKIEDKKEPLFPTEEPVKTNEDDGW